MESERYARLRGRSGRAERMRWAGFLVSAGLHVVGVLVAGWLLAPMAREVLDQLVIELAAVDESDDLLILDDIEMPLPVETLSLVQPAGEVEQLTVDLADPIARETGTGERAPAGGAAGGTGHDVGDRARRESTASARQTSGNQVSFYGTTAQGKSFVYILDVSPSMGRKTATGKTRIQQARDELCRSIDDLTSDQWLYVMLFSWDLRMMFDDTSPLPQLVRATPENKRRVKQWVRSVPLKPGTDPRLALDVGLKLNPSTIFFLSDGEFNQNPAQKPILAQLGSVDQIVQRHVDRPAVDSVPIHTIAYEDPQHAGQLARMSSTTGGQHRFVQEQARAQPRPARASIGPREGLARAEYLLRMARSMRRRGKSQAARVRCRTLIEKFPGTDHALQAEAILAELP